MKNLGLLFAILSATLLLTACDNNAQHTIDPSLKVVIIRHGEKPENGDNLSCQGFNRALGLTSVLQKKIGMLSEVLVPALDTDESTAHSRMFQTITPFAVKYNVAINSKYSSKENEKIAAHVLKQSGTVLMVWDHSSIKKLAKALGVHDASKWEDADFDSIWQITYPDGKAKLMLDKEGLTPSPSCSF